MKYLLILLCSVTVDVLAQSQFSLHEQVPGSDFENIQSQPLSSDSNVSSFLIWIRKEVKPHLHAAHSEHVYVLEGSAQMLLDGKILEVNAGDLFYIPQGVVHAVRVTSEIPLKVLSVQAPYFDGKDRIPVDKSW